MDKQFYYEVGLDLHKNYSQVALRPYLLSRISP